MICCFCVGVISEAYITNMKSKIIQKLWVRLEQNTKAKFKAADRDTLLSRKGLINGVSMPNIVSIFINGKLWPINRHRTTKNNMPTIFDPGTKIPDNFHAHIKKKKKKIRYTFLKTRLHFIHNEIYD